MSILAQATLVVFIAAWVIAAAAWIYGTYHYMPIWWSGIRRQERPKGYGPKALIGYAVFLVAIGAGFAAGGVADIAGGWG